MNIPKSVFLAVLSAALLSVIIVSTEAADGGAEVTQTLDGNRYSIVTEFTIANPTAETIDFSTGEKTWSGSPSEMKTIVSNGFILSTTSDGRFHLFAIGEPGTVYESNPAKSHAYNARTTFVFSEGKLTDGNGAVYAFGEYAYVPDENGDYVNVTSPIWNTDCTVMMYDAYSKSFGVSLWSDGVCDVQYHSSDKVEDTENYIPPVKAVKTQIGLTEVYTSDNSSTRIHWIVPYTYTYVSDELPNPSQPDDPSDDPSSGGFLQEPPVVKAISGFLAAIVAMMYLKRFL